MFLLSKLAHAVRTIPYADVKKNDSSISLTCDNCKDQYSANWPLATLIVDRSPKALCNQCETMNGMTRHSMMKQYEAPAWISFVNMNYMHACV